MSDLQEIVGGYVMDEAMVEIRICDDGPRLFWSHKVFAHSVDGGQSFEWAEEVSTPVRIKHLEELSLAIDAAATRLLAKNSGQ